MNKITALFGLRFTTGHAIWAAALIPACILVFIQLDLLWLGITLAVIIALAAVLTIRGRRVTGWIAARFRMAAAPSQCSRPAVGTRGRCDRDARRSRCRSLAGRLPGVGDRAGAAAVHADGDRQRRGLHRRRRRHPARRASGRGALPRPRGRRGVGGLPGGQDGARRVWSRSTSRSSGRIPRRPTDAPGSCCAPIPNTPASRRSGARSGVAGLARYLVASATRIADQLASNGIDARPIRSFDDFDRATEISFERETWSAIKGRSTFTAAYSAPGGPDVWWSARADHTITRVRIRPGAAPTATVLLTTLGESVYTARVFVPVRRSAGCAARRQSRRRTATTSCRSGRPACSSARPRTAIRCTCRSTTST